MNDEQENAWAKAEKSSHAARKRLMETTRDELVALLEKARDDIIVILADSPSDYQQWRLTELQKEIGRVLGELGESSGRVVAEAAGRAWAGGIAAIDSPLAAAGFKVAMPHLDTGQLMAMRTFMVERITDISVVAASKIRQELGLAAIGSQGLHDTMTRVTKILGDSSRARATTIVRTELSRTWAYASHERALLADREDGVDMDKIWRRSGKVFSRESHDWADGQRVAVHKPFLVGSIQMRFPHDPKAPAAEVINCGCIALYRPRGSKGTLPDTRAFTEEEISANPYKAVINKYRQQETNGQG